MPEFDFGHFHILEELGRGGMALVYKATDTRNQETVALKILYPHLMSDENTIKRFQREAKVASSLKHDNIVPVVDFGEHDKQIYIAMEYMAGNSMADLFAEPRAIKINGVVRLLREVASALDYAHDKGVIHRDLKLQNILLDDNRHAHLSDFGIARLVDGTRLTATGQIAGTPMYMSPEQIRGKRIDHRSDIYSFSVMAYLMLTGYYPFTGEDSLAIIHKHVKEYPPLPTDVNAELPEAVNPVLLRGLMKSPDDRYDSTIQMVDALQMAISDTEYHKTTTRIDIHAVNPVDSVEMEALPAPDSRVQSATQPAPSVLQSDLSSAVMTGTKASGTSRLGVFGLVFGIIAVAAIAIPLAILAIAELNEHSVEVAEQTRMIEFDESSGLCHEVKREFDAEGFLLEAEIEREFDCTGVIMTTSPNGAQIKDKPGPPGEQVGWLPNDTEVAMIGRDEFGGFVRIVSDASREAWISSHEIQTEVDIVTVLPKLVQGTVDDDSEGEPPATPNRDGRNPDNNSPNRDGQNRNNNPSNNNPNN